MKMRWTGNKRRWIWLAALAVFLAALLSAAGTLARQALDDKANAAAFAKVAALVEEPALPSTAPAQTPQDKYAKVYAQNSDMVGWISIEGTTIDYPVMQTVDEPNFYLKHGFDRQYSAYGVPFVAAACAVGTSDNIQIFGHHMKDGSMFADLCKYADEGFYRSHKTIQFDTLSAFGTYDILAAFKSDGRDFPFYRFIDAADAAEFDAYVRQCKDRSLYDTGVSASYGDKLITLSTCEYSQTNGRFVVVAKLADA